MRVKQKKVSALAAALLIAALGGFSSGASRAQDASPSPAPAPAQSIPTATVPDVQIVVSPDPSGQWIIAAVYPSKTDRAKAEARAKEMLSLGKWKGGGLIFENKALERTENPKGMAPPPVMSSVTLSTPGNIVNYADGTIDLEPFIRAYRDLDRLNLLFLVPGTFNYRGPRSYSDADIDLTYASGGSALTYVVQVKNPSLGKLQLPQFEPAVAATIPFVASPKAGANATSKMIGVIVLALTAAGLAFVGVQRWNNR